MSRVSQAFNDASDPKDVQRPPYKAILIGGPNDGETFGMFDARGTIFAVDRYSLATPYPDTKPAEFGRKPRISSYTLKNIAESTIQSSVVRTYFFNRVVQDPYDE